MRGRRLELNLDSHPGHGLVDRLGATGTGEGTGRVYFNVQFLVAVIQVCGSI